MESLYESAVPVELPKEARHEDAGHREDSAESSKATRRKVEQGIPRHEELSDETPS